MEGGKVRQRRKGKKEERVKKELRKVEVKHEGRGWEKNVIKQERNERRKEI